MHGCDLLLGVLVVLVYRRNDIGKTGGWVTAESFNIVVIVCQVGGSWPSKV
jgi:hypothetical protein